ncbi:MAG: cytochrome-c oxidase, cbb3-type subunit, partial [Bacteroidota bacterium]
TRNLESKINAMRTLGVPYAEGYEKVALSDLEKQAQQITNNLKADNIEVKSDREVIALIAYLQRLGVDITKENKTAAATSK